MTLLSGIVITTGFLTGMWGLFHQLIVGGAVTMMHEAEERNLRIFLMTWVAHGAYISLTGFLPAVLLLIYNPYEPVVLTACILVAIAILILSIHVGAINYKFFITPIWIGWSLQTLHGIMLVILYFVYR